MFAIGGAAVIDPRILAAFIEADGWTPPVPDIAPGRLSIHEVRRVEDMAEQIATWDGAFPLHSNTTKLYVDYTYGLLHVGGEDSMYRRLLIASSRLLASAAYQSFDLDNIPYALQCNRLLAECGKALGDTAEGKSVRLRERTILARMFTDVPAQVPEAIKLMAGVVDDRSLPAIERALAGSVTARAVAKTGDVKTVRSLIKKADRLHNEAVGHLDEAPPWLRHHDVRMHLADTGHAYADVAVADPDRRHRDCANTALRRFRMVFGHDLPGRGASPITKAFCAAAGGLVVKAYRPADENPDVWAHQAAVHASDTRSQRARAILRDMAAA